MSVVRLRTKHRQSDVMLIKSKNKIDPFNKFVFCLIQLPFISPAITV